MRAYPVAARLSRRSTTALLALSLIAPISELSCSRGSAVATREPDVPYEPTPPHVVDAMLRLAGVRPGETVYDLGCGDGRIVISAVRDFGARGVGVDIGPQRIRESRENAERASLGSRVEFRNQDLFETAIGDADVVTLFLWPEVNLRLRPKLLRELRPGTRVVSYMHDMGDWKPLRQIRVQDKNRSWPVFLWQVPEQVQ